MHLHLNFFVAIVALFVSVQRGTSDESNKSREIIWICSCSYPFPADLNYIKNNCSRSCDCIPGGTRGTKWSCSCSSQGFPEVSSNASCFTSCKCKSDTRYAYPPRKSRSAAILILASITAVFTLLAVLIVFSFRKYQKPTDPPTLVPPRSSVTVNVRYNRTPGCFAFRTQREVISGPLTRFLLSELETATEKFSSVNLIGIGGSCRVYRGRLRTGETIAVKRLKHKHNVDDQWDYLFYTEVEILSRLHHCHVVPLLGYCSEHQSKLSERLLVFEYMPNGNLREWLDRRKGEALPWETRVSIALGAARGLEYLHEAAAPRILHRDVKSTNVLLDGAYRAKITDLGLAKRLTENDAVSAPGSPARIEGTFGYLAPEYAMVGKPSVMSDVFSFGVVLLEIITGRNPIEKGPAAGTAEESLVLWATPRLQNSGRVIEELPDPRLRGRFHEEEMQIMAYIAKECLMVNPEMRPTMSEVVQMLSTIAADKSRRRNMPSYNAPGSSPLSKGGAGTPYYDYAMSPDCMEKLLLLSGSPPEVPDDVVVHLTEPRLESFCVSANK